MRSVMTTAVETAPVVPVLIGGKWSEPKASSYGNVHNPSSGEVIGRVPMGTAADVDAAVQAAQKAYPAWSNMPVTKRANVMFKFRELLNQHFDELCRLCTRENGKTIEESKGDVRRGIEVVEFACGIAHLSKGESLPQIADELDAVTMR